MDKTYEFRLANTSDIDEIMSFIGREWKPDHILATDRDFFCYEHQVGDKVNFLVAVNKRTGRIDGLEGFIQYSEELMDVAGVIWSVGKHVGIPFLGVRVVNELKSQTGCRFYGGPGTNPKTAKPLQEKILKHHVGEMKHYYRLSSRVNSFKIADIKEKRIPSVAHLSSTRILQKFDNFEDAAARFDFSKYSWRIPFKDGWYVRRRYFEHPIYHYQVWGTTDPEGNVTCLLVGREVEQNSARALRVVDCLGDIDSLEGMGGAFERLVDEGGYEYADLYCCGVSERLLESAGLLRKDPDDKNIIPNYFEPYIQKNITLYYSVNYENATLFKGDADQDRPNSGRGFIGSQDKKR
jgi:hypothetical protein